MAGSSVGPSRIVVTGDVLRPSEIAVEGAQNANIDWLHAILEWPLSAATQIVPEKLVWQPGGFEAGKFYECFDLDPSLASWAEIYRRLECPPAAESLLLGYLSDALVIAFELSPLMAGILDRHGITYVNMVVHPVRFLDDIFFAISTNNAGVYESLLTRRAPEELFHAIAGVHKAAGTRVPGLDLDGDTVLIAAQTPNDKTLIDGGKFLALENFLEDIDGLLHRHDNVLFKRHPLAPELPPELDAFLAEKRVRITNVNLYTLLSERCLTAVHSISSSASHEAQYFGKSGEYFFQPHYDIANDDKLGFSPTRYVSVVDAMFEADFWRGTLSSLLPTTVPTGSVLPGKPNRLRVSMREFWGYNEVDADVMTKMFVDRYFDDLAAHHISNYSLRAIRRALKKKFVRFFSNRSRQ